MFFIKDNYLASDWGLGFTNEKIRQTILYGISGGLIISVIEFPSKYILDNKPIPEYLLIDTKNGILGIIFTLLILTLIVPTIEELIFRGYIYRNLRIKFNIFWGYIISTILFSLAHGFNSPIILYIISSTILTYLYEKTKSLGTSIIAHCIWNFTWYTITFLAIAYL